MPWFPPALAGFVLIAIAAWDVRTPKPWFGYSPPQYYPQQQFLLAVSGGQPRRYADYLLRPEVGTVWLFDYWQAVALAGFVGMVIWYGLRFRPPARRLAAVVVAGLVVLALSAVLGQAVRDHPDLRVVSWVTGVPLLVIALAAGVLTYYRRRRSALAVCLVCLTLGVYGLAAAVSADLVQAVTIALGLAAVAWLARSVVLAAVIVVFLLAAVPFVESSLGLLVPGAVLVAGTIAVLVVARRPTAAAT